MPHQVRRRKAYAQKVRILVLAEFFVLDGFFGQSQGEIVTSGREKKVFIGFRLMRKGRAALTG
jgi:hypothetical protein